MEPAQLGGERGDGGGGFGGGFLQMSSEVWLVSWQGLKPSLEEAGWVLREASSSLRTVKGLCRFVPATCF